MENYLNKFFYATAFIERFFVAIDFFLMCPTQAPPKSGWRNIGYMPTTD
jgi:hypothetical protein